MGKSKVICPICNKEFERATAKKKYCGTECQRLANIKHTREKQKMQHPGKVGRPVKKREKEVKRRRRHESELVKVAREAKQAGMTDGKYVGQRWQQEEQKKERQKNEQRNIEQGERA